MTVGLKQCLVLEGLQELNRRLADCDSDKRLFVFVIPSGQSFSCPGPVPVSKFQYYTLELNTTKGVFNVLIEVPE